MSREYGISRDCFLIFSFVFFSNWVLHMFYKIHIRIMFSGAVVNDGSKISISSCSLLVYRNGIEFHMPTLYLMTLLGSVLVLEAFL